MSATKKELADKLGVAKQTVVNYVDKLGLAPDHVKRVGRGDVLDDFACSAIAAAVGKSVPAKTAPVEDGVTTSDAVVAALNDRIADLKDQNDRLVREMADLRAEHERETASLRLQVEAANARADGFADRLADIAEKQQAIAALPWWRRGRVAMRLLGPGGE